MKNNNIIKKGRPKLPEKPKFVPPKDKPFRQYILDKVAWAEKNGVSIDQTYIDFLKRTEKKTYEKK